MNKTWVLRAGVLTAGLASLLISCASDPSGAANHPASSKTGAASSQGAHLMAGTRKPIEPSPDRPVIRVAGDLEAQVSVVESKKYAGEVEYRFESSRIDTPLPMGYPPPTAPGAVELKFYPSVRRAQIGAEAMKRSQAANAPKPDSGMNRAFMPLFRHIDSRKIAMTSPVEMDYASQEQATGDQDASTDGWSMSFLYRVPENGPAEQDGNVRVYDTQPVIVLSIGQLGAYSSSNREKGLKVLNDYLAANPEWEAAGPPRAFYYNDPFTFPWRRWSETQIPVRLKSN